MNHTKSNAHYVAKLCKKFIRPTQSSSNQKVSIQQIQDSNTPSDLRLYLRCLTGSVHFKARALRALRTSLKGAACSVAAVLGIAMFMPMAHAPAAQIMPIKNVKQYAKENTSNGKEWSCLSKLYGKESAWNHLADNPHSSAFGIPQILGLKTLDPFKQIDLGIKYIKHRYDTPCKAWRFHQKHGWY